MFYLFIKLLCYPKVDLIYLETPFKELLKKNKRGVKDFMQQIKQKHRSRFALRFVSQSRVAFFGCTKHHPLFRSHKSTLCVTFGLFSPHKSSLCFYFLTFFRLISHHYPLFIYTKLVLIILFPHR